MIEVRNVQVVRGGVTILHDITLALRPGEIVGLIGPPEAGKTVLIKTLAGLIPHDAGSIYHDTVALDTHNANALAAWQLQIGFAFQNNALFDVMTVFDNVAFPLRRRAVPESDIAERVATRLADVGLTAAANALPATLSGGMQKRVGIARATIVTPVLGLFDDPIAGLDPLTSMRILQLLQHLTQSLRMATVIISNDLGVLLPICQRLVMLCAGRVVYNGLPADILRSRRPDVVQFATGSDTGPL